MPEYPQKTLGAPILNSCSKNPRYTGTIGRKLYFKGSSETTRWISYLNILNKNVMKINKDWIVGFVDGEGCFYVGINKSDDLRVGYQVLPEFRIVQHKRDIQLLYAIKGFFGYGVVVPNKSKNSDIYEYRVRKFETLHDKIVPFFESNNLLTTKKFNFLHFREIILIMKRQEHLNEAGLARIVGIKNKMNKALEFKNLNEEN